MSQPEAVALATATTDGAPSVRMVLVKRADHDGFVFFTNYESRKGGELAANPRAALLFHWEPFGRQVRIEGPVERTTREESEAYAHSRAARQPAERGRLAAEPPSSRPRDARRARGELPDQQHAGAEVPAPRDIGAAFASPPRRSSSGSTGTTACMTACATARRRTAAGRSSGSRPKWSDDAKTAARLIRTRGLASVARLVAHVRADPARGCARGHARRPRAGLQLPRRRALRRRDRAPRRSPPAIRRCCSASYSARPAGTATTRSSPTSCGGSSGPSRAPPPSSTARSAGWASITST